MPKKKKLPKKRTQKYYVQGMHCSTCEILIDQDIRSFSESFNVNVSLAKSYVVIESTASEELPNIDHLNEHFKELGYTFHQNRPKENLTKSDVFKLLALGALFVLLFFSLERSGLLLYFSVSSESSIFSYFIFGIAAGLSSCAALVGGLLLSLSSQWNKLYNSNKQKSILPFIYFNFSRILAFAFFGGVLGYVGSLLKISITWTSLLTVGISILMVVLGLQMLGIKWFQRFNFNFVGKSSYLDRNKSIQGRYIPIIVGALTFFVPCGFTLIAQTNALNSGSAVLGAAQLSAFALGTLPVLALISFTSLKFYSNPKFAKKFSLFSGVLIVVFALYNLNSQLNVLGLPSLSDINLSRSSSRALSNNSGPKVDFQVLQMEAVGFEYLIATPRIQSGVRTEWQIYNSGALGCANAVYSRGLYPDVIQLVPGMNTVEFISPAPGIYKISCSMGMVPPVTVEVY